MWLRFNVLDEKEIQDLYATIKNWGTEYRNYKLEDVDAFSFMAVMKDLACKREAEVELLKKGTSIVKDTLEQNDWKKCENHYLKIPCDQLMDPNDNYEYVRLGMFPPYSYCKDKGLMSSEQEENISTVATNTTVQCSCTWGPLSKESHCETNEKLSKDEMHGRTITRFWCETTGPCTEEKVWEGIHWKYCDSCQCKQTARKSKPRKNFGAKRRGLHRRRGLERVALEVCTGGRRS